MILRNGLRYQIPPHTIVDKSYWLFRNALMQSRRQVLKLQMTFLCVFVRLRNVSIYRKLQKQIFRSQLYLTKYTSINTPKTLNFLSDVRKVKYKEKKSPENRRSQEAIKVQMDMSHMRVCACVQEHAYMACKHIFSHRFTFTECEDMHKCVHILYVHLNSL